MIRPLRQLLGAVIGVAAVALPAWALFHLVRQGSCGDVGQPACPDEVLGWVGGLVGSFIVVAPLAILIAGRDAYRRRPLLLGPIGVLMPLSLVAGVVCSLVGSSADPDTRWIGYVVGGIALIVAVPVLVGVARRLGAGAPAPTPPPRPPQRPKPKPRPAPKAAAPVNPMATLAGALEQLAQAKAGDELVAARLRRLDALRASGAIDDAEHRRRRDEILAEI